MTLLSRLFPGRRTKNRRPARSAAKPRTASRLGVESLDDRVLMSATAAIQSGSLYINADPGGSQIYVQSHPNAWGDLVDVRTGSPTGPVLYQNYLSEFNKLYFYGKGGNDTCVIDPALTFPTMLDGGAGNDLLIGGGGNDLIFGGSGNDSLQGGLGSDALLGNDGNDALYGSAGADWYDGGDGYDVIHRNGNRVNVAPGTNDVVVGLVNDKLTSMELAASGKMMVSQIGGLLTISGPTGAGFNITGNWQSSTNAAGGLAFTATGPVTLLSALGGIPFGAPGVPITIHTKATPHGAAGEYSSADLGGFGIDTNSVAGPLATFKQNYGLGITINQPGHQVGLSLGSGLADMDGPLNPAVPYFFYKGDTSGSLSLYGTNVPLPGSSVTGSIAFDPSDPMLFVRLEGLPSVPSLGFAASAKGNIPFQPVTDSCNVATIYGNLYLEGAVTLGDYPVLISGDMVLDLDANDDGAMAGLTSRDIGRILTGQKSLSSALGAAMSDIRLGANGAVTATLEKGPLSINMPLTEGTVQVTPNKVEFRGRSANMFQNVPLLSDLAVSPAKFDVSGYVVPSTKAWGFSATATTATIGGFKATGIEDPYGEFTPGAISLSYNSGDNLLVAAAHLEAPGGLWGVDVSGTVDLANGNFSLNGEACFELNAGLSMSVYATATFQRVGGTITFHSDMYAWFSSPSFFGYSVSGVLEAHIDVTIYSPTYFVFSGTGSVAGAFNTPADSYSQGFGVTINNEGLKIDLPSPFTDLWIDWTTE